MSTMATVAHMRTSKPASQKNGKLPSFAAEAGLFIDDDNDDSPSLTPSHSDTKDSQEATQHQNNEDKGAITSVETSLGSSSLHNEVQTPQVEVPKQPFSTPPSPETAHHIESAMSLHEMFDGEYGPFQMSERRPMESPGQDEWFTGDGDLLNKQHKLSSTPPLSLYQAKKEEDGISDSPGITGVSQVVSGNWSAPSSVDSGRNTPTSNCGSMMTHNHDMTSGSVSSTNSSAPRSMRPVLYSAIGSLENLHTTTAGSLKKRYFAGAREFSKMGAAEPSLLIPPPNQQESQKNSKALTKRQSSQSSQDKRPEDKVTPPSSNTTGQKPKDDSTLAHDKQGARGDKQSNSERPSKFEGRVKPLLKSQKKQNVRSSSSSQVETPGSSEKTEKRKNSGSKKVSIDRSILKKKQPKLVEMFRPSCDAYTPRMEKKFIKYKPAEMRTPVQKMASPMGTLQRPNFRDALRRVAMIMHQHIVKIERRFESSGFREDDDGLFKKSMRDAFSEDTYCTPTYRCTMVRMPMARPGMVYGLRKIRTAYAIPTEGEIYEFAHQLFKSVQLSSECSIVCLIYVERLMEIAKVPLMACTWRPIFMCGLLLASKVWQDLSSWNIEFASVYPQYSLESINRLELTFLRNVKWDLYISSSLYAKYYFALRSLVEKHDFRQRYNRMVGGVDSVAQSEALKIQKRTEQIKEEALQQLSRSM